MNVLDSSGWIEYFANGPNADRFASVVVDTATLLVPSIVLHEVYRWADRESGELAANRAVVAMRAGLVVPGWWSRWTPIWPSPPHVWRAGTGCRPPIASSTRPH